MNLLCPNCQEMLTVPEENAGQLMKCQFCNKYFSVPALPPTTVASGPPVPRPAPVQSATLQPAQTIEQPPPSPPLLGDERSATIWISPRVLRWITPIGLLFVLILLFFPWTGVYPGGYGVYTQSGMQMIWGGHSVDPVGDKVLGMESAIERAIHANGLMFVYFLFVAAALVVAATPLVMTQSIPPALRAFWPWRPLLVVIAVLLAFLILLSFLVRGSGFEDAVKAASEKPPQDAAVAAENQQPKEVIERGMRLGQVNLSRTFWLHGAVFYHIVAFVSAGLELWLHRRGERPLPRMEFHS